MEQKAAHEAFKEFKKQAKQSGKVKGFPTGDIELMKKVGINLSPRIAKMSGAVPNPREKV